MSKYYLLYDDINQSNLLAASNTIDGIHSQSKYYESGVWFEYDVESENHLVNEKEYEGKYEFPSEPLTRELYIEDVESSNWIS